LNLTSSYPVTSLSGNQKLHLQRDATYNDGGRIRRTTPVFITIVASVVTTTPALTILNQVMGEGEAMRQHSLNATAHYKLYSSGDH